jgi:hypothetical protein
VLQIERFKANERIFDVLKLSVPSLMGIFVFLNPFPHTTAIKEICFYSSFFIALFLIYLKKIDFSFKSPLTLPFVFFVIWVFIGLFFALDKENSIHDFRAHLLKYLVIYYILINFFNSRKRLIDLSWVIITSATIFSIGEIYYFYFMLGNSLSTKLATGLTEIPVNWVGYITVTAIIFSLHYIITNNNLQIKIISLISLFPLCALSILTQARSTSLALFLSVIILCFRNKKIFVVCLGIILIAICISPIKNRFININPITSLRLNIHYTTIEIIKDFPVIGIGFGMETYGNGKQINLNKYNKKTPEKYRGHIYNDPHSMPFSIAVRTGLVGLALFLYIFFISFKMCLECIRHGRNSFIKNWGRCVVAMLIAVIVIGFFEPFFSHVPEIVFYATFAIMTVLWKLNNVKIEEPDD